MTPAQISRARSQALTAALVVVSSLATSGVAAKDFASTRPTARVEYWQQRQAAIAAQLADPASLRAVKLVFVGDSITDLSREPLTQALGEDRDVEIVGKFGARSDQVIEDVKVIAASEGMELTV